MSRSRANDDVFLPWLSPVRTNQKDSSGVTVTASKQRAGEGHDDGQCHRAEHLPLDAGERQDGHIHQNDDAHGKGHRAQDFPSGRQHIGQSFFAELPICLRQSAQDIVDHHDGAVDQQPEVDGAQAHEIAGESRLHHAGEGDQHRRGEWPTRRSGRPADRRERETARR